MVPGKKILITAKFKQNSFHWQNNWNRKYENEMFYIYGKIQFQ
jgi:hypothetical protein